MTFVKTSLFIQADAPHRKEMGENQKTENINMILWFIRRNTCLVCASQFLAQSSWNPCNFLTVKNTRSIFCSNICLAFDQSDVSISRVHYFSITWLVSRESVLLFVSEDIYSVVFEFFIEFFKIWIYFFTWILNFITLLLLAEMVLMRDSISNILALLPSLVSQTELLTFSS